MTPEQKRKFLKLKQMQAAQQSAGFEKGAYGMNWSNPEREGGDMSEYLNSPAYVAETTPRAVAYGAKAVQGIPFAGEWVDEGVSAIDPVQGEQMRKIQQGMDETRPKSSLAAEIGFGALASAPLAVAGAGKAMDATTKAGRVLRGTGMAATAGAAEGAAAGAGRANDGDRASGAAEGAMVGGAIGGVVGALAPVVGDAAKDLALRVKKLDVSTIMEEFGLSRPAARRVKASLANDDLSQAAARLNQIGDDAMLGDAGMSTAQELDTAMSGGGQGLRIARERIEARAEDAGKKLSKRLDSILGPADGVKAAQTDISRRTSSVRQQAYDRAWSTPIDYTTGAKGEKVMEVLDRIPDRYLSPAIRRANERAQMSGEDFTAIMASVADDGRVTFSEMPNVRQLHEIKVALDDIVRDGTDPITGKLSPDAADASRVAGMLRDALKEASPAYARATRLGGDKIAEENAMNLGRKVLNANTTLEDVRDIMSGASAEAKAAARRGMREQIEQTLSNVRRTITDPNTDAREAMQLVKAMSSRANQNKARFILGTDAKALFDELESAEAALALRAAVSRNSATAVRQAGQDAMKAELQPGLLRRTLGKGGNPLDAAREVTEAIAGIDGATMSRAEQAMLAEIADALTGIRGKEAERAIAVVNRAMAGQPIKNDEAALIGRTVAGVSGALGYQSATQSLSQ